MSSEDPSNPRDPALSADIRPEGLSDEQWLEFLSSHEFQILRKSATESPGSGPHLEEERAGAYHCVGCGNHLYSGEHKFHSGCGWPSFFQAVTPGSLTTVSDNTHGMVRTEMRCAQCDGHLGHIFPDAPHQPGGKRHCVNGLALIFVPEGSNPRDVIAEHRRNKLG